MELGEKIFQARQAAGLSQRQLCGDTITRNMLSQIEHGTAKPSMGTLKILAERLGKPVSFFLEEELDVTPNRAVMEKARTAWDRGDAAAAVDALSDYQGPDPIFNREYALLMALSQLAMAEMAYDAGKKPYARTLLDLVEQIPYEIPGLARQKALLEAKLTGDCGALPSLDEELFLRAKEAFAKGQWTRSLHLLEAMEVQDTAQWQLLRGELYLREGNWQQAAVCFHRAEGECPLEAAPKLEQCYRELGDFKQAYCYACKQKNRDA